jgi:ribosomal 50S subunit-recycling heat shock protein
MTYTARITESTIGNDRVGVNARIIRTSDSVEVGKILVLKSIDEADEYITSVNELIDQHPDFKPNENY